MVSVSCLELSTCETDVCLFLVSGLFRQFVARWKRSFNKADERTSVLTFLLYGGLNRTTFLRRLRFSDGGCCGGGLNSSLNV